MSNKPMLTYHGDRYEIDKLRYHLKEAPHVTIRSDELDATTFTANATLGGGLVEFPPGFDDSKEQIAVCKFNGKYVVLLGVMKLTGLFAQGSEFVFHARLISKHVLKKAQFSNTPVIFSQGVQDFSEPRHDRFGERGQPAPYRGYPQQQGYSRNR